jgi:hypothetical protein
VLIGGAGGGREALALAANGYHVTAFEPSVRLARSMAAAASAEGRDVGTFVGRYEDLPLLFPCDADSPPVRLDSLGSFDAGVLGWTSYSHIRTGARREEALRAMAAACRGPVLLSFFPATSEGRDAFSTSIGFYHRSDENEIRRAAERAGLHVWYLTMEDMDGRWPYAVVARSPRPTS